MKRMAVFQINQNGKNSYEKGHLDHPSTFWMKPPKQIWFQSIKYENKNKKQVFFVTGFIIFLHER